MRVRFEATLEEFVDVTVRGRQRVDDSSPDVQIDLVQHGLVTVRARAFPDPASRAEFVAEIRTALARRLEEPGKET